MENLSFGFFKCISEDYLYPQNSHFPFKQQLLSSLSKSSKIGRGKQVFQAPRWVPGKLSFMPKTPKLSTQN